MTMHTSAALLALAILLGSAAGAGAQAPVQCNGAPLQAEELPSFSKQPYIVVFKGEGELQSASQGLTGVGFKRISQLADGSLLASAELTVKELEEVAATAGVAYIECDFTVEILRAPVVCNGQTVKDIPATASDYIVAFKASANLQAASQALLAVKLQEVSQLADGSVLAAATLTGAQVEAVAASAGVQYIECDQVVEALKTPVTCNGQPMQEIPFTAAPYIVAFQTAGELQAASQALSTVEFEQTAQLADGSVLVSATLAKAEVEALAAREGVKYIECDSDVEIVSAPVTCDGQAVKDVPAGKQGYIIAFDTTADLQAASAALAEIEFEQVSQLADGSVLVSVNMTGTEVEAVAALEGVQYIECDSDAAILSAPVTCDGQTLKDIPATAAAYMVAFESAADLQAASQELPAVGFQQLSELADGSVLASANMTAVEVEAVAALEGVQYIECDSDAAILSAPVTCDGQPMKDIPATAAAYMVAFESAADLQAASQELPAVEFQQLSELTDGSVLASATMTAGEVEAVAALEGVQYIECDSAVEAFQAPVTCNGQPLQEIPVARRAYIVGFKASGDVTASSQGLGGLEFKQVAQLANGAVMASAMLSGQEVEALAPMQGVQYVECDTEVNMAEAVALMCEGKQVEAEAIPTEARPYIITLSSRAPPLSVVLPTVAFEPVSQLAGVGMYKASLTGDQVTLLLGQGDSTGLTAIECDGSVAAVDETSLEVQPPFTCDGFEVPFIPGRYMVHMKGDWTRPQLVALGEELAARGDGADYFQLHNTVATINIFSATFSQEAMDDLMAEYGEQIKLVECDGMATAAKTKLYCRGAELPKPLPGKTGYLVNVVSESSLQAVQKHLGDLQAVGFEAATPSPSGSPQFTAMLTEEAVTSMLKEHNDDINYLQCSRESWVRETPVIEATGPSTTDGATAGQDQTEAADLPAGDSPADEDEDALPTYDEPTAGNDISSITVDPTQDASLLEDASSAHKSALTTMLAVVVAVAALLHNSAM